MDPRLIAAAVALSAVIGALLPLLTAVIQQPAWSTRRRQIVAWAVSAAAGLVTATANGDLTHPASTASAVAAVIAAAEAAYRIVWQPSGITGAIETATSPDQGGPELAGEPASVDTPNIPAV